MSKKNQSNRLTTQHTASKGVLGIFGAESKWHEIAVSEVSQLVMEQLQKDFPLLSFRYRTSVKKEEINAALRKIDAALVLPNSSSALSPNN